MYNCKVLNSEHRDLIHDVAFNWYGTHMATCSSDQTVRVWAKDPSTKQWKCTASWKCHSGSVWKVTWAHPEYGQVLATCSFDRTAAVWEEMPGDGPSIGSHGGDGSASGSGAGQSHWVRKTILVDSRTSVTDVKFGPRNLSGFMLATSSGDGTIRVYEALDVMNLSQWTLQHEIAVKLPLSCISWNHSINKNQAPMLAAGSDDPNAANGGKVFIYEFSESNRRWHRVETISTIADPVNDVSFAPNVGRSYSVLAVASKNLRIITLKSIAATASHSHSDDQHGITKYEVRQAGQFNDHNSTVWRVCWNTTGTVLASSGDDGHVRLWKSNYADQWKCVATLQGDGSSHLPAGAFVMTGHE